VNFLPELSSEWPDLFPGDWAKIDIENSWLAPLLRFNAALLVILVVMAMSALLSAITKLYRTFADAKRRPIKGYIQIVKMVLWIFGIVIFLAVLTNQEVGYFVTGMGAMTAVLLLVFKDTIMSLVASVQLTQNDMIRVGDWIEVPSQGADGDVIDVALHMVKIQNFDKTITNVPTYTLLQSSFKNWRGMSESGGRRIKRSLAIDMSTVRFLTDDEVSRFSKFKPLSEYMKSKLDEINEHNSKIEVSADTFGDTRRLTNIGTFRAYVTSYLAGHDGIHQEGMTRLVRQLAPGPQGVPIEIYVFGKDIRWGQHEAVQGDIFDHLMAMLSEFGLAAFQEPTSLDFREST
jgi:miniconductance mechanosensitive channel